jgi:hypothetical protein
MTLTDIIDAVLIGGLAGASALAAMTFGAIAGRSFARRYRWRGWRKLPERRPPAQAPPRFRLKTAPLEIACDVCGHVTTLQMEIEGPFDGSPAPSAPMNIPPGESRGFEIGATLEPTRDPMPLGERLLAEKRKLMARLDKTTETEARRRVLTRVAAIDRELGRFN